MAELVTNFFLLGGLNVTVAALDVLEHSRLMAVPSETPEPKPKPNWQMTMAQAVKYVPQFKAERERWMSNAHVERLCRVLGCARRRYLESVAEQGITEEFMALMEQGYLFDGDIADIPDAILAKARGADGEVSADYLRDWMDYQCGVAIWNLMADANKGVSEFFLICEWLALKAGGLDESVYSATLKRLRADASERRADPAGSVRPGTEELGRDDGVGAGDPAVSGAGDDEVVGDQVVAGVAGHATGTPKSPRRRRRRQQHEGVRAEPGGQVAQIAEPVLVPDTL